MTTTRPTTEQITHQGQLLSEVLDPIVNPQSFGAVGNGIADDTAAIQSALNAANGKKLVFPDSKTYRITGTLLMPTRCHIDLGMSTFLMVGSAHLTSTQLVPSVSTTVTSGATASSIAVDVVNTVGIAAGNYFSVQSNGLVTSGAAYEYPTVYGKVVSVVGSTVTIDQQLPVAYGGTVSFFVYPSMYESCVIENGTIDLSQSSAGIGAIRPNDYISTVIDGVRITGATLSVNTPVFVFRGMRATIRNCSFDGGSVVGQVYQIQDVGTAAIERCSIDGGGFGCAIVRACDAKIESNSFTGRHAQEILGGGQARSVRAIKPVGNATVAIIGNYVNNYDTGVKYEYSFRHTTVGNSIFNTYAMALNQGSPTADTAIAGYDVIANNIIENTGLAPVPGPAVGITAGPNMVIISGNILRNIRQAGVYMSVSNAVIQNNSFSNWNLASGADGNGQSWGAIHFFGAKTTPSLVQGNTFRHTVDTATPCITLDVAPQNVTLLDNLSYTANPLYSTGAVVDRYSVTIDKSTLSRVVGYNTNSSTYPGRTGANHIFNGSVTGTVRGASATSSFVNVVGGSGFYAQANGTTSTFTSTSSKLFTIGLGNGKGAMAYADYASSTIDIVSDPSSLLQNSASPSAGRIGVHKGANSHVISVVNNTGGSINLSINVLGASASATTDPA